MTIEHGKQRFAKGLQHGCESTVVGARVFQNAYQKWKSVEGRIPGCTPYRTVAPSINSMPVILEVSRRTVTVNRYYSLYENRCIVGTPAIKCL